MTGQAVAGTVCADEVLDPRAEQVRAALRADLDTGFALVVREYQQSVHATVLRFCGHHADAEDVTAEVFLRAYRALRGYSPDRIDELRPRPWLVTIALNIGRNALRDTSRRPRQVALEEFVERPPRPGTPDGTDGFDGVVARLDHQRVLADLVARLPQPQRVAVLLRHLCELSSAEIAEVTGCPEGTVRSHVSRGLTRLRALVVEHHPGLAAQLRAGTASPPVPPVRRKEEFDGHDR